MTKTQRTLWTAFGLLSVTISALAVTSCFSGHTHDYVASVSKATCTMQGYTEYTCICGDSYQDNFVEPLGHDIVEHEGKEPTCVETGWKAYEECLRCTYTTYEGLSSLGHDQEWHSSKSPTCTESGWESYVTCARCDYTTYEESPALEHEIVTHEGQKATCTSYGWNEYETCNRCNYTTYEVTLALGHNFVNDYCERCQRVAGEGLEYTLLENDTYAVTGRGSCEDWELVIPSTYNGKAVTAIGERAFWNTAALFSIHIPASVIEIGEEAFVSCRSLKTITVAEENTLYCSIDGNLYTKDGKTLIQYAVGNQEDTTFKIPALVTTIQKGAFQEAVYLTEVTLPASVAELDEEVFADCKRLKAVLVATDNVTYKSVDGNLYTKDGKTLLRYAVGKEEKTFVIPDSVTSIGKKAFIYGENLIEVTIPETVNTIGESAFAYCNNLKSMSIPNGVTVLENYTFRECIKLERVELPDSVAKIAGGSVFDGCINLIKTENGVGYVDHWAVKSDGSVTSVTIKDGTRGIADGVFYNQGSLTEVKFPKSLVYIGESAFMNCNGLTSVEIPGGEIGKSAFFWCKNLSEVLIGDSVTVIGEDAFGRLGIKKLSLGKSVTSIGAGAFTATALTEVTIPDSVLSIGEYAFSECADLTSVRLGKSVAFIGKSAFYKCESLTEAHIEDVAAWCAVTLVNEFSSPFYYTGNLYVNEQLVTELVIPDTAEKISDLAFAHCDSLISVVVSNLVTSIGDHAFYYCENLTKAVIGNSVENIGSSAFSMCSKLKTVVIGSSVKTIGAHFHTTSSAKTYYAGTAESWALIYVHENNRYLLPSSIYYYSKKEPTTEGKYWYYDKNGEVVVWG